MRKIEKQDRSRCLAALLESSCQKQSLSLCKINLHTNCTGWISPLFLLGMLHGSISGLTSINHSWIPALFFLLNPHTKPRKLSQADVLFQITIAIPMPYLGPVYFTSVFIGTYYQVGLVLPKRSAHTQLNQSAIWDNGKRNGSRCTHTPSWFLLFLLKKTEDEEAS